MIPSFSASSSRVRGDTISNCASSSTTTTRPDFSVPESSYAQGDPSESEDERPVRVRRRRSGKPPSTQKELEDRSDEQDAEIQALLERLDHVKMDRKAQQWLGMSYHVKAQKKFDPFAVSYDGMGLSPVPYKPTAEDMQLLEYLRCRLPAHCAALEPGLFASDVESEAAAEPTLPDIVKYGVVSADDIFLLWRIFFDHINTTVPCLDPRIHTPSRVIWECPFLFTAMCALASRFSPIHPHLYPLAMKFANDAAGKALVDGKKSLYTCQAYIVYSVFPMPGSNWHKVRSWMMTGAGAQIAAELGLHRRPPPCCDESEAVDRVRAYLSIYVSDAAHLTSLGNPPTLPVADALFRELHDWYKSSRFNSPLDIYLVTHAHLMMVAERFHSAVALSRSAEKAAQGFDVVSTSIEYSAKLAKTMEFWVNKFDTETDNSHPMCHYSGYNAQLLCAFLRLAILTTAFPLASKRRLPKDRRVVDESIDVACECLEIVKDILAPSGIYKFAMEAYYWFPSFVTGFLINLLRPQFFSLLDPATHQRIRITIGEFTNALASKDVAVNERHLAAMYARFLTGLLDKHDEHHGSMSPPLNDEAKFVSQPITDYQHMPPDAYHQWPDTSGALGSSVVTPEDVFDHAGGAFSQPVDEAEVDFSMQYFLHSMATHGQQDSQAAEPTQMKPEPMMSGESGSFFPFDAPTMTHPYSAWQFHIAP
ncbi:hypothetical protein EVG20_g2779 [Dentipellis fragilis]|uniref:Xylanolytic transcriptional activator regulatory domain-containing protein n=1 Tax=Dentipellis fragilis TaxID=205917 RepID=A0A4Y9Z8U7_9AGAM|nr:hypothetical protein EVG20_g2779 [Dentipellis fragilis]